MADANNGAADGLFGLLRAARAACVLDWRKEQTARHAPAMHDSTVCLPMSGSAALLAEHGEVEVRLGGLVLLFRAYTFRREGEP